MKAKNSVPETAWEKVLVMQVQKNANVIRDGRAMTAVKGLVLRLFGEDLCMVYENYIINQLIKNLGALLTPIHNIHNSINNIK
mgnify:CR=1 FL=1